MIKKLFCPLLIFFLAFAAAAAEPARQTSLALYGEPKYVADFKHFDYVNPQAPKGGRLVLPEYGSFDNFNPFIFKGLANGAAAALSLESLGLVPEDDHTTVYPLLAEAFELPKDRSYVGFFLNPAARFSDGSPVTADDVIFSFNALIEKGAPLYKVYYADVERVEKLGDRHLRFHFRPGSENRELPLILSQFKIFSARDFAGRDFAKPELRVPLGSGPYLVERFEPGKYVELKRRPDYWGQDLPTRRGFFNFDRLRYDYYQDTTVTLQALFAGAIDMREEYIAKIWAGGYNNELVRSGRVIREELEHNQAAVFQAFAFNLRRRPFQDRRLRQALGLAFNFDWANDKLFYHQYRRLESYFTNTGMEARQLPAGKELELLKPWAAHLPPEVFSAEPQLPRHRTPEEIRANLRRAVRLLQAAGYDFVDGRMTHLASGKPLEIEILSNSSNGSSFTRVMLPFIANLKKIGVTAVFRNQEVNIFKNRLDQFDFDIAIIAYGVSQLPGNELREFYGSAAADLHGSYNISGIKNPAVDALVEKIISAGRRSDYQTAVQALDRVLRQEYYAIPHWYSPYKRVAYRRGFAHPQTGIKAGFDPMTWWDEEDK